MELYDLFLFAGKSNMAGRGITCEQFPEGAPSLLPGAGAEFRAISDPTRLYPICEPFGVNENNPQGIFEPGMKTGSMVTAFVNSCFQQINVPILGVSASKGGSVIEQWQGDRDFLSDAIDRVKRTLSWCREQGIEIRHRYVVWCQGESNGDHGTSGADYKKLFHHTMAQLFAIGFEQCFLVVIGQYNGDRELSYEEIIRAQRELGEGETHVTVVCDSFCTMKERGLMKDAFHYYQAAYNEVGTIAGEQAGMYINSAAK